MESKELICINVAIPQTMKKMIEQYVAMDTHTCLSEFVRDAIRQKLEKDAPKLYKQVFQGAIIQ